MRPLHALARWMVFNAVGALGMGVQLAVLALLVGVAGLDYLLSTAIAVESAVLHNFVLHQRWTWSDRPAGTARSVLLRLAKFHILNGAVSLLGNLVVMSWLVGARGMDPIPSSLAAISACSVVNFLASTALVFRAIEPGCRSPESPPLQHKKRAAKGSTL